jgi:hypothetical protein
VAAQMNCEGKFDRARIEGVSRLGPGLQVPSADLSLFVLGDGSKDFFSETSRFPSRDSSSLPGAT